MNKQKLLFTNLPTDLKVKIVEYLLYKCPLCHKDDVYFDTEVIKCFECKKHHCKLHSIPEIKSTLCYNCFEKKKDDLFYELLGGIEEIANISRIN